MRVVGPPPEEGYCLDAMEPRIEWLAMDGHALAARTLPKESFPPYALHEGASLLTLYCREIGRLEMLPREEEAELARQVRQGDEAAREKLIKANLRLVVYLAHEYEGRGVALLDLISEGNIGLMKAVDRYDPAKGAKLSGYATYWIQQRMRLSVYNHGRTIRVPIEAQFKVRAAQRASVRLHEALGRPPRNQEIAEAIGVSWDWLEMMFEAMRFPVPLDEAVGDRDGSTVAELVADELAIPPDEAMAQANSLAALRQALGRLSSRERSVLRDRFGLEGTEERTLEEIGYQFGLTRERVRQIQSRALAKLRRCLLEQERIGAGDWAGGGHGVT